LLVVYILGTPDREERLYGSIIRGEGSMIRGESWRKNKEKSINITLED